MFQVDQKIKGKIVIVSPKGVEIVEESIPFEKARITKVSDDNSTVEEIELLEDVLNTDYKKGETVGIQKDPVITNVVRIEAESF